MRKPKSKIPDMSYNTNNLTYQQAFEKLQSLVAEIEQDQVALDELSLKVEEAKHLLEFCSTKLRGIQEQVRKASGEEWIE